jgi:hypothetical protein
MQMKAGVAQVALHPTIAEGYMLVKREGIAGVAPPTSSVPRTTSQALARKSLSEKDGTTPNKRQESSALPSNIAKTTLLAALASCQW